MSEDGWSRDELKASVLAYADMYEAGRLGRKINKAQIYRDLAAQFDRKNKAFERRMMNISHVVESLGGEPVRGLLPAPHIGSSVESILIELVNNAGFIEDKTTVQIETTEVEEPHELEKKVTELISDWVETENTLLPPRGLSRPTAKKSESMVFSRSPEVKAWVIKLAGSNCESCDSAAPFVKEDGTPYLEVHHVVTLAEGGPDTIGNTVAICPNCHRALHYSKDKDLRIAQLYRKVERLQRV